MLPVFAQQEESFIINTKPGSSTAGSVAAPEERGNIGKEQPFVSPEVPTRAEQQKKQDGPSKADEDNAAFFTPGSYLPPLSFQARTGMHSGTGVGTTHQHNDDFQARARATWSGSEDPQHGTQLSRDSSPSLSFRTRPEAAKVNMLQTLFFPDELPAGGVTQ